MSYFRRLRNKIRLWWIFFKLTDNFFAVCWYRTVTMLHLQNLFPHSTVVSLKNGIKLNYGKRLDLSAVPTIVEIWFDQSYTPKGFAINKGDTVLDLGANVGNFCIYAAKQGAEIVYAFEPIPENFELLKQNISLNKLENIVAIQAAINNRAGSFVMHLSAAGTSHSMIKSSHSSGQTAIVPAIDVQSFCHERGISIIDFLKMDCEGAENEIVLGFSSEFLERLEKIAIEHHERLTGMDHTEINRFLQTHGYKVFEAMGQYIYAQRQPV